MCVCFYRWVPERNLQQACKVLGQMTKRHELKQRLRRYEQLKASGQLVASLTGIGGDGEEEDDMGEFDTHTHTHTRVDIHLQPVRSVHISAMVCKCMRFMCGSCV